MMICGLPRGSRANWWSAHSSYLAHEVGFEKLRYFKRKPATGPHDVPTADVIDLSCTFGSGKIRSDDVLQTAQFVARYLKTTHCDLFLRTDYSSRGRQNVS
jgi:predicted ATP-dependent endonuclease of OLD family